jgi:hypothetical protein
MKIITFRQLIIVILVLANFGLVEISGQNKESFNKSTKITMKKENESLGNIFRDLINNYDIAIGFEESVFDSQHDEYLFEVNIPIEYDNCVIECKKSICQNVKDRCSSSCQQRLFTAKEKKISINVENEPVENVLNQIVMQMQYYKWEINDGVVNITPIIGEDTRYKELLNVKLKHYSLSAPNIANFIKVESIRESLYNLPEFRTALRTNNLFFSGQRILSPNLNRNLTVSYDFSNLTFKELLNRITKVKRGGWILRRSSLSKGRNYEFVEIDI